MVDDLVSDYTEMLHQISVIVSDDYLDSETVDGVLIRKLFVSNLAERTTFKNLKNCFSIYGNIESCYLCRNEGKKNYAFVTFSNTEDAMRALKDGNRKKIRLHNRDLRVIPANSWHQPDSIEQHFYNVDKKETSEKKTIDNQYNQECLQNNIENVSIHKLNNACLKHIFQLLPIVDRVRVERVCKRWRLISQKSWHTMTALDLLPSTWGFSAINGIHTVILRKILLKCGRFLTRINLSELPNCLTQNTLIIVGKLCPNLMNIDVSALTACAAGINTLAHNCKNITKLSLGPSIYNLDNDLKNLFKAHKNLEYLAINKNNFLGKCLSHLSAQTIHTIILNKCSYIQDNYLSTALERFENLKNLTINECTTIAEYTLEVISKHCKNLTILELHGNFPSIQTMDMLCFTVLINLQVLKITNNIKISDRLLVNMTLYCQQLTCIDITGCCNVTDTGLAAIATLTKLKKLTISYIDCITDRGLLNIYGLIELECRACPLISDEGISRIIISSPQLQLLDLSGCTNVTNITLDVAKQICNNRSSNVMLKMIVGGTSIYPSCFFLKEINEEKLYSPFLQTVNVNLSIHKYKLIHTVIDPDLLKPVPLEMLQQEEKKQKVETK